LSKEVVELYKMEKNLLETKLTNYKQEKGFKDKKDEKEHIEHK